MKRHFLSLIGSVLFLMLTGCSSVPYTHSTRVEQQDYTPAPGKALVIFLRPGFFGGANPAAIYEVRDSGNEFVAALTYKEAFAYQAEPGKHFFMVANENAEFMPADLVAGKTYYAFARDTQGLSGARFVLMPFKRDPAADYSLSGKDLADWKAAAHFVVMNDHVKQWAAENATDIEKLRQKYMKEWAVKSEKDKQEQTMDPQDGT